MKSWTSDLREQLSIKLSDVVISVFTFYLVFWVTSIQFHFANYTRSKHNLLIYFLMYVFGLLIDRAFYILSMSYNRSFSMMCIDLHSGIFTRMEYRSLMVNNRLYKAETKSQYLFYCMNWNPIGSLRLLFCTFHLSPIEKLLYYILDSKRNAKWF